MKNYRWIDYDVEIATYQNSPREREEESKLCIREHRRETFPNELDWDFEQDDEFYENEEKYRAEHEEEAEEFEKNEKELFEKYFVFSIDMYEHWNVRFSLWWEWMQCGFDTSSDCWFIAIPKNNYWKKLTKEDAIKEARRQLQEYTNYCNWGVYEWFVDYPSWDREYFWEFYGNKAEDEAEKECKKGIDRFLEYNKKFTVKAQYSVEEDLVFYGKDEQDVYEQAQNYELPKWYIENTFDIRAIFDENWTQFFDKDNRF